MKRTLLKIVLVAVFSLLAINQVKTAFFYVASVSQAAQGVHLPSKKAWRFARLLAMETQENLKTYQLGLKALFPFHHIPSAQDLFDSIRSHPRFLGFLTKDEASDRFTTGNDNFVIFEEKNRTEAHFYVVHNSGSRHFTVNQTGFAGIDNYETVQYPSLARLLKDTVAL